MPQQVYNHCNFTYKHYLNYNHSPHNHNHNQYAQNNK